MPLCQHCNTSKAALKRPKTGDRICKQCFFDLFELEIHTTIKDHQLFMPGEKVAIGASGGKDSTVLAYVLKTLNDRYNYQLSLVLLSIDEGIKGYRDDSLATVRRNMSQYNIPLLVVSYKELYNWSMDEIVQHVGLKNNCTFCGVFRRQALDRGAVKLGVDHIVTGHNADDIAVLRGDYPRLSRCTSITTQSELGALKRSKPFKYTYEKEIVLYAYFKKLDYFSTECTYAPQAFRGYAQTYLKDLESIRPSVILDIIKSGETFANTDLGTLCQTESTCGGNDTCSTPACGQKNENNNALVKPLLKLGECDRCGYMSSQKLCKACVLLEGLNRGLPTLGIGKTDTMRRKHGIHDLDNDVGQTIVHMNDLRIDKGTVRLEQPVNHADTTQLTQCTQANEITC